MVRGEGMKLMKPIHYLAALAWVNFYAMCWVVSLGYVSTRPWGGIGVLIFFFAMAFTFSMIATGKKDR